MKTTHTYTPGKVKKFAYSVSNKKQEQDNQIKQNFEKGILFYQEIPRLTKGGDTA